MDLILRCQDCRRIVHGLPGGACPYCGGARLNRLEEHAAPDARLHPPVVKLAIAFCLGLAGMQVAAKLMDLNGPIAGHGSPFWHLNLLVGACTGLYLILRRQEGDFRALFIAAFGLFAFGEGLSALSRAYGIGALHSLSGLFRHALLVFSSLSLTAGAADGPAQTRHERVMLAASGGFLFLSVLHLMMEFLRRENDRVQDAATALVALSLAIAAALTLASERAPREAAPKEPVKDDRAEELLTPEGERSTLP